ncbi:hypothetical protein E9993_01875 [Labilibacter sediminis]|nr:hypothetical protein E9993_01875 [Labilibacter sediminis]
MENSNKNIDTLIVAYLTNDISEDQLLELNSWIDSSAQNRDEFQRLKQVWDRSKTIKVFDDIDVQADWKSVNEKLFTPMPRTRTLFSMNRTFRKVAAVSIPALLVLGSGLLYWNVPGFGRLTSYHTNDTIQTITLSDNSTVILNTNSSIVYPKNIDSATERTIKLKGEAYFEVVHNNTPFIVDAGEAEVRVLGTKFNVNQLDSDLHVSVFSGKVSVEAFDQRVELTKNEKAKLSDGVLVEEDMSLSDMELWYSKDLKFRQANIKEICTKLKESFQEIKKVNIVTKDLNTRLTTNFTDQSLNEIIEELQIHFDKKIVFDGSVLTISD